MQHFSACQAIAVVAICIGASFQAHSEEVAVEAIGYATLERGETLQEVHRKALKDASINAVVQTKVSVDVSIKVEDMHLHEKGVRTRGMGFINQMVVQEAGLIPYTDPPVYRVRVRALVRPMPTFPPVSMAKPRGRDAWKPVLDLAVKSEGAQDLRYAYRTAVANSLRSCGIEVQDEGDEPALQTTLNVKRGQQEGEEWLTVEWDISFGETEDPMDIWGNPSVRGNWQLAGSTSPSSEWWQRLGVLMAQDAMRLWNSPRPVKIKIQNMTASQLAGLSRAISPQVRISTNDLSDGGKEHVLVVPLAGNSLDGVNELLRQANILDELERERATLAEFSYKQRYTPTVVGPQPTSQN